MFNKLRFVCSLQKTVIDQIDRPNNSPFLQFVRWRKRRWSPKNPSKIFYVREPTPIDPEEWAELKVRYDRYYTHMRAIRHTWKQEYRALMDAEQSQPEDDKELELFEKMLVENEKWNKETAKIREQRQNKIEKDEQEAILHAIFAAKEEREILKQVNRQKVLQEKEEQENFIKLENLEEEIEKALNARVNYNYAIDLKGHKYIELPDGSLKKEDSYLSQDHVVQAENR